MEINLETLKQWTSLKSRGDGKIISDKFKVYPSDVSRAFKDKKCTDKVFAAMAKYYSEKAKKVKKLTA